MKLVNHVLFLVDSSGSILPHVDAVKEVFKNQIQDMRNSPIEARITVWSFNHLTQPLCQDQPAETINASSILSGYHANGGTALIDSTYALINAGLGMQRSHNKFGEDHTFLLYVITDGEEIHSRKYTYHHLSNLIRGLNDSWTVACMVPNLSGVNKAKMAGFPTGNIEVWNTASARGFEEVGKTIASSYKTYNTLRTAGVRSSSNIFKVDADNLKKVEVKNVLDEISGHLYYSPNVSTINTFVESKTGRPYKKGSAYYELVKTEKVQDHKQIVIISAVDKSGKKYGGQNARDLLGIPAGEVKLTPGNFGNWRIFVQSTSMNRKIVAGTSVFVAD